MAVANAKAVPDERILSLETVRDFRRDGWVKLGEFFTAKQIDIVRRASIASMQNPPDIASAYEKAIGSRMEKRPNARDWANKAKEEKVVLDISQDFRLCHPEVNEIITSREAGLRARELLGVGHVRLFQST